MKHDRPGTMSSSKWRTGIKQFERDNAVKEELVNAGSLERIAESGNPDSAEKAKALLQQQQNGGN